MPLLDDLRGEQTRRDEARKKCRVAVIISALEDDDAADLREALNNLDDIKSPTIVKVLRDRQVTVSERVIQRHRSGGCSCFEEPIE